MSGYTAETWAATPAFTGRLATQDDVTAGDAVFAMGDTRDAALLDEPLPSPVIWYEDEDGDENGGGASAGVAALVIQAETHGVEGGDTLEVLGLLLPGGRTAVGFGDDVDWVDGSDPVWRDLVEDALFSGGGG